MLFSWSVIIAEHHLCYHISTVYSEAKMDVKLMLTEREIAASYADREGFISSLRVHILEHSSALNTKGYLCRSTYDVLLAEKLRGFIYMEEKVIGL